MCKLLYWLSIFACILVVIGLIALQLLADHAILTSELPWWLKVFLLGGK